MTSNEINNRFGELSEIKPERINGLNMYSQEVDRLEYPNFCRDPRLVLEVMMKRKDWPHFQMTLFKETAHGRIADCIPIIYMKDTTGLLALKGIEWLEMQKGK